MAKFTLKAGGVKVLQTPSRWLNVFDATGVFILSVEGLADMQVKKDWQVDVAGITQVEVRNDSSEPITLDIENTPLPVKASGGGAVTIEGKPVIQRIEESIQVTADATVQDGSMKQIVPNAALTLPDVTIPAGQTVEVIAERAGAFNRKVILQTVSESATTVRVGFTSDLTAGEGVVLRGYKDSPASIELTQATAVYVHNESAEAAKISVSEVWRS